jgi:hypothetical protein
MPAGFCLPGDVVMRSPFIYKLIQTPTLLDHRPWRPYGFAGATARTPRFQTATMRRLSRICFVDHRPPATDRRASLP